MLKGVYKTRVGYTGGVKENPTYHDLGDHTESLQIDYDPSIISYDKLLEIFWKSHDFTARPWSIQYAPIIFYNNENQRISSEKSLDRLKEKTNKTVYTKIKPLSRFYLAENYHQKYYLQLMRELKKEFGDMNYNYSDFVNSTSAARINGYIKGYGQIETLMDEIDDLGLSKSGRDRLIQIVKGYRR